MQFVPAGAVHAEAISYRWRSHLPNGMLVTVAGIPGQGKSLFASLVAAEVSHVGGVIYSTREDPLAQVARPRLEAAGADLSRVDFWTIGTLPLNIEELARRVHRQGVKLIVLDPISAHLSVSLSRDHEVRRALEPLAMLADSTGCSVLLISHTIKSISPRAHPLAAVGGSSSGLVGVSRAVYLFGADPEDEEVRVLAPAKSVDVMPPSLAFEFESVEFIFTSNAEDGVEPTESVGNVGRLTLVGETDVSAEDLITRKRDTSPAQPRRADAAAWLTSYLRLGPRPAAEIREDAERNGHTWRTIRRASKDLGILKGRGPGSTWELPPELRGE